MNHSNPFKMKTTDKTKSHALDLKIPGWLSEAEMQDLTGFKTTKLWQLRVQGRLKSSKIGKKTFYNLNSWLRMLEENEE